MTPTKKTLRTHAYEVLEELIVTQALKPGGRIVISNRIHHRTKSMAAAQKAGLKLDTVSTPVPTHFIAAFTVEAK